MRDTGNAFTDFWVKGLKQGPVYSAPFSSSRPSGKDVGNWLLRDPAYSRPKDAVTSETYNGRLEQFRAAYTQRMNERLAAENAAGRVVFNNVMAEHDRVLGGGTKLVASFGDDGAVE